MTMLFTGELDNFKYCNDSELSFSIDLINLLDEMKEVQKIRINLKPMKITFSFNEGVFFMKDNEEYFELRLREMNIFCDIIDKYFKVKKIDPFIERRFLIDSF
jgi:hypothetical protein